jgi:hypothetical protein
VNYQRRTCGRRSIAWLLAIMCLSGCATSSPIQRYADSKSSFSTPPELFTNEYPAKDVYRIYHRAATGFVSIQSIRQAAEQRAEEFARRQGRSIITLGEQISHPPYILGNFPRIEIVFALIDQADAAAPNRARDRYAELAKLKKLLDDGTITQDEFQREKGKILDSR